MKNQEEPQIADQMDVEGPERPFGATSDEGVVEAQAHVPHQQKNPNEEDV